MRIGIDASPLLHRSNGVGCHTYELLRHLLELNNAGDIVGYVPDVAEVGRELEAFSAYKHLSWASLGKVSRWTISEKAELDLFHGPNFKMYFQGRHGGIVTIHDVFLDRHPQYSKKLFGQKLSYFRTNRTVWKARRVITVSLHAAGEIRELYGLPEDRVCVIPNGVSEEFTAGVAEESWLSLKARFGVATKGFILFLGGSTPRKNHQTVFRAYSRCKTLWSEYSLICIGSRKDPFGDVMETARKCGIMSQVVSVEHVSLEDLKVLYSAAAVFVFPSLYEGFGMPVLEAMASGTPVIASNATALPEVVGDAGILVDPLDEERWQQAIVQVIEDRALRTTLIHKGRERARAFTWGRTACQTYRIYQELCQ